MHQFVTFSTNTPVQHAIADFLETRRGLAELGPFFQAKRDLFLRLMEGSRFRPLACRGSYFQLMDYSAITDEADADFAIRLTKEHGVASIPTSPFLPRSDGADASCASASRSGTRRSSAPRRGCKGQAVNRELRPPA